MDMPVLQLLEFPETFKEIFAHRTPIAVIPPQLDGNKKESARNDAKGNNEKYLHG